MKRQSKFVAALGLALLTLQLGVAQQPAPAARGGRGATPPPPPPVVAKPEELAKVREKTEQIEALVKDLRAKIISIHAGHGQEREKAAADRWY